MEKSCRFCGTISKNCTALFIAENADLLAQANAVYPLLIYEDDPLPKHACRRCQTEIRSHYSNMQRTIKLNSHWINIRRGDEEMTTYAKLLDQIECIKNSIRKNHCLTVEHVLDHCIERMLKLLKQNKRRLLEDSGGSDNHPDKKIKIKSNINGNSYVDHKKNYLIKSMDLSSTSCMPLYDQTNNKHENINFQNTLRQNESLLTTFGDETIKEAKHLPHSKSNKIFPAISFETPSDEENLRLAQLAKQKVNCQLCQLVCQSQEDLILHKTKMHLEIRLRKIFPKKRIQKTERKGLLVTDGAKHLIRCQSCYRVYEDRNEILEHWKLCKCIYYCFVCSEIFPNSPQLLHTHVRRAHGISHTYLKQISATHNPWPKNNSTSLLCSKTEGCSNAVKDWKVGKYNKQLQNKYMETKKNIVIKNELIEEDAVVTAAEQTKKVCTTIGSIKRSSSIPHSTPQKGLIKVKALEELLSTPAKVAMLNIEDQYSLTFKEEPSTKIVN